MKVIPVNAYDCIAYDVEDGVVVLYGMKAGKVIERHVLDRPAAPQKRDPLIVGLTTAAVIILIAFIALLSGYPEVAQTMLNIIFHIFTKM